MLLLFRSWTDKIFFSVHASFLQALVFPPNFCTLALGVRATCLVVWQPAHCFNAHTLSWYFFGTSNEVFSFSISCWKLVTVLLLEGQCSFWLAGTCRVSTAELSQLKPLLSFRGPHRSQFGCAQLLQFGYPLICVVSAMANYIFF